MSHLLIQGHPRTESFCAALGDAWMQGVTEAGGQAERVNLIELSFDPILRGGFDGEQQLEPDLRSLQARIAAASHVTFAFPTWWAGAPALVKGFVDRTFLPGWAFQNRSGQALPDGLLTGRSARVITTMDSPWWWYWLAHRRSVHRAFVTATLKYCGIKDVRETTVFGVRALDDAGRKAALERARRAGAADA